MGVGCCLECPQWVSCQRKNYIREPRWGDDIIDGDQKQFSVSVTHSGFSKLSSFGLLKLWQLPGNPQLYMSVSVASTHKNKV